MINDLDVAAEVRILSEAERDQLTGARDQLTRLLRDEEIKYYQCAEATNIMLGDNNTRYLQMVVNGKRRKKEDFPLDDNEEGKIEGQTNLKAYITHFYKDLFGPPEENSFTLDESLRDDIPQVTTSENESLTTPLQNWRFTTQYLTWNIIKHKSQMDSQLSSTRNSGKSSKGT
jgi:hypothetical protein